MKYSALLTALAIFLLLGCQSPDPIDSFTWLEGKWIRQDLPTDKAGFEEWHRDHDGLIGLGQMLANGEVIFTEKLALKLVDNQMAYIALPDQNNAPVNFIITESSDKGFTAENPAHDFPQKIVYRLTGDTLKATVSAGERKSLFVFIREHK